MPTPMMPNRTAYRQRQLGYWEDAWASSIVVMPANAVATARYPAAFDGKAVRFGIIGVGMQGSGPASQLDFVAGNTVYRCCRPIRRTSSTGEGSPVPPSRRPHYREVLDDPSHRLRDVARPTLAQAARREAVAAGKDVYCEKPMSHSIPDGLEMVAAVQRSGRILQVGSQRVSSPLFVKAKEIIASGTLGELTQVELTIGRNSPLVRGSTRSRRSLRPPTLDWATWLGTARKHEFDPKTLSVGVAGTSMAPASPET